METIKLFMLFNKLCLKYNELTIEYNKIYPDNQRYVYFKDQFPNVYQEFMKVFSIVPGENNLNILTKYFKLDVNNENELIRLLKENEIDNIYHDEEYQTIYNNNLDMLKKEYNELTSLRFPEDIMYIYLKLLTQKLEYVSDTDKNYLLNYILNLLKNNKYFKSIKLSENANLLENYSTLIPKNDMEINKYYQMTYDLFQVNYGGEKIGTFDICPLHLDDIQEKNININKINCDSDQISRGNNKKFLSDNNNLILQYNYEEGKNSYDIETKKYIVGDKVDSDYINNKMNEIMNKYKINNVFSIDLMSNKLYEEIIDKLAKMPTNLLGIRYNNSNIFHNSVYLVDKEIDRKYFNGKLSYFGKFFMSMRESIMPNDKICSNYAITSLINYKLYFSNQKINIISLYIMYNYIKDQLDEWLKTIKPLLGIDDKWNYDINKDTIRKKVLNENPKLIKKYDKLMNINYTKLFTLDPVINNEDKYNIIKSFSDSIEFYLSQILSKYTDIELYVITTDKEGNDVTLNKVLDDIRDNSDEKKNITYSNNAYLDTYGFKKYFTNMLKDFKSEESMLIYTLITDILYTYMKILHPIENLTDEGMENIFNDYAYKFILRQTSCPRCVENFYKLYTEGFIKIFEEINIYKQYQETDDNINTTLLEDNIYKNNQETDDNISQIIDPSEIFDENYILKYNLHSLNYHGEYYYTVDEYCPTNIKLKANSNVVIEITEGDNSKKFVRRHVRENIENPSTEISEGLYRVELAFKGSISAGSQFDPNIIKKMKFYKALNVKPKNLEVKKAFIDCNAYYNDKIYATINNNEVLKYKRNYTTLFNNGDVFCDNKIEKIDEKTIENQNNEFIYISNISDSEYPGKYLITKDNNYVYNIDSIDNLKQMIKVGNNNKYILYNNQFYLSSNDFDQYYLRIDDSNKLNARDKDNNEVKIFEYKTLQDDAKARVYELPIASVNIGDNIYGNIKNSPVIIHIEGARFYYTDSETNVLEFKNIDKDNEVRRLITRNNNGYVIVKDADIQKPKIILVIITNEEKFKKYINKNIYPINFDYETNNNSELITYGISLTYDELLKSYLVLNKPQITYNSQSTQGKSLDTDLFVYDWKYYIDHVNVIELKDNIFKDIFNSLKDKQLQKEFSVKDFNKLMLRKCFPYNFKRTLLCNQDVLDAVDGSKYSIPNSKIKETLCEYGKYPYYLEHYFMTSRIDYKLKGKFNIRCLANLSTLPDVTKYLDTDELNYQIKEVIIQGKDMIIKDGKIASSGDVYLVGIELSNDHMFRVPPSKITNKGLLKVIDVQQFDNIYDRVELYLDDSDITDFIVKPLTLSNMGTLKNMKYINYY